MESESSKTRKKEDPGWNYNRMEDPTNKRSRVICNFCDFPSSGGIYRAKQHQMGGFSAVKPCEKVPLKVKQELLALYHQKLELNERKKQNEPDFNIGDDADDVEVEQAERNSKGKRAPVAILGSSKAKKAKKAKKTKDLKDLYSRKPGERTIQLNNHQEKWAKTNEDENTYDAAGSSGGPTGQSFPHNEEFQLKDFMAFCGMPVIKELWKAYSEVYRQINTETSKGKTKDEQEFSEEFKSLSEEFELLSEDWPDMTEEVEKLLDEHHKRELNGKWPERFKKILEEEGITEKFKAIFLKYKEEDERQTREKYKQFVEELEEDDSFNVDDLLKFCHPEMLTGNLAGSLNVSSNCEGKLQSSSTRTTPVTANAMKSIATEGKPHHDPLASPAEPHHDPLAMQGGTTAAAGSSGGPNTQSSPHNAKI